MMASAAVCGIDLSELLKEEVQVICDMNTFVSAPFSVCYPVASIMPHLLHQSLPSSSSWTSRVHCEGSEKEGERGFPDHIVVMRWLPLAVQQDLPPPLHLDFLESTKARHEE